MHGGTLAGELVIGNSRQEGGDDHKDKSRTLKWTIISSSVVTGLIVDYWLPGWGRPISLTLLIFGSLVGFCHAYWSVSFWALVAGLLALHSALVIQFQRIINELPMPGLFLCALAEIIVIAIILGLVFPDKKQSQLRR